MPRHAESMRTACSSDSIRSNSGHVGSVPRMSAVTCVEAGVPPGASGSVDRRHAAMSKAAPQRMTRTDGGPE
jgi:hypothetical protein